MSLATDKGVSGAYSAQHPQSVVCIEGEPFLPANPYLQSGNSGHSGHRSRTTSTTIKVEILESVRYCPCLSSEEPLQQMRTPVTVIGRLVNGFQLLIAWDVV